MRIVELRRHAERDEQENITPRGLEQCARAKATLELPYDAYYTSPARRSRATLALLGGGTPIVEERLSPRPRSPFASYEMRHRGLMAGGIDPVTAWFSIPEAVPRLHEVGRTVMAAVLDIAAKLPEGGRALAVTHGGTIEPFAVVALGRPYKVIFGSAELGYCEGVRAIVQNGVVARIDIIRLAVPR